MYLEVFDVISLVDKSYIIGCQSAISFKDVISKFISLVCQSYIIGCQSYIIGLSKVYHSKMLYQKLYHWLSKLYHWLSELYQNGVK